MFVAARQPRIRREYASSTNATYTVADQVAAVCIAVGLAAAAFAVRRVPERHGAAAGAAALFALLVASLYSRPTGPRGPAPGAPNWDAAHTGWPLAVPVTLVAPRDRPPRHPHRPTPRDPRGAIQILSRPAA